MSAFLHNLLGREFGWVTRRRAMRIVLILCFFVIPGVGALIVKTLKESSARSSVQSVAGFDELNSSGMFRDNLSDWAADSGKYGPFLPDFSRTHRLDSFHQSESGNSLFEHAKHLVERSHGKSSFPQSLAYESSEHSRKRVIPPPFTESGSIRLNPTLHRPGQSAAQFSDNSAARLGRDVSVKKEATVGASFPKKISRTGSGGSNQSKDSPKTRTGIRVIEPNSGVSEKVTAGKMRNIRPFLSGTSSSAGAGNTGSAGNARAGSSIDENGLREFRPVTGKTKPASNNSDSPFSPAQDEDELDRRKGYLPLQRIGAGVLGGGLLAAGIAANENGGGAAVPVAAGAVMPGSGIGSGSKGRSGNGPGSDGGGSNGGGSGTSGGGEKGGGGDPGGGGNPIVISSGGSGGSGAGPGGDGGGLNGEGTGDRGSGSPAGGDPAPLAAGAGGGTGAGIPMFVPPPIGGLGDDTPISDIPGEQESPKKKRSKVIYWTVQPDQTIQSLAASVSCSAEDIRALNKISFLVPGQTILLPVKRVEVRTWTQ